MTTVSKVEIFEIGHTEITWFQQVGVKGTVWVDGVRLRFAPFKTLDAGRFCGSDAVVNVAVGKDPKGPFADFSLKNAAPANKVANAAASLKIDAPKPDKDGFSTFTFSITPVFGDAESYHTVLAVPLGADIGAIEGPAPTRQRLLSGFVAYYFEHGTDSRQVRVRYKVNRAPARALDVAEINP
jgi:hypothetical protein